MQLSTTLKSVTGSVERSAENEKLKLSSKEMSSVIGRISTPQDMPQLPGERYK